MSCKTCQGDTVMREAWVSWDEELQQWILETVFDDAYCGDCDQKTTIVEEPLVIPIEANGFSVEKRSGIYSLSKKGEERTNEAAMVIKTQ